MPRFLVAAAAVLAMVCASGTAARAAVPERVAQDDATVVCRWHDRDRALEQMRGARFTHVRINVIHARGPDGAGLVACAGLPATLDEYDRAVEAVRAAGLVPQLTLVWNRQPDARAIADWMGEMAAHFAPEVQRFSVLNEPDLTIPAVDDCDPQAVERMVTSGLATKMLWVKRYVRRGGRYVHRVFGGPWSRGRAYAPRWRPVYRWARRTLAMSQSDSDSAQQAMMTVRQGCLKVQRGRIYRRIFAAAEPAIRAAAPGAQVLAGETSPVDGVDLFIGQVLPVNADGWAHHCYQWNVTPTQPAGGFGIGDTARVQALVHGMPLYYTECGYPNAGSQWNQSKWNGLFTHDNEPQAYAQMWQFAKDQGLREMSQFGWCASPGTGWDTSLMTGDGCDPSPEYAALQRVLTSWG